MSEISYATKIAEIKTKLQKAWSEEVISRERYRLLLASDTEPLNAPLSDSELINFERKNGIRLPEDYRQFLKLVGDGGAGPHKGILPLRQRNGDIFPLGSISISNFWCRHNNVIWNWCHLICDGHNFGRLVYTGMTDDTDETYPNVRTEYVLTDLNFRQKNTDFLTWYDRWLDDLLSGKDITSFGLPEELGPSLITFEW